MGPTCFSSGNSEVALDLSGYRKVPPSDLIRSPLGRSGILLKVTARSRTEGINQEPHFTARAGPPVLRLVGFLPSTVSKRFFLLESGKRMQRTAYSLRNHGSEAFVAQETAESDACFDPLWPREWPNCQTKTGFWESDRLRKSKEPVDKFCRPHLERTGKRIPARTK